MLGNVYRPVTEPDRHSMTTDTATPRAWDRLILLAWGAAVVAYGLVALAVVAQLAGFRAGVAPEGRDWLLALLCAPLGARIASHAPRNACGWLILSIGLLSAGACAASIPAAGPVAATSEWLWWPPYGLLVLVLLLFPDGRPLSSRWNSVIVGLTVNTVVGAVALISLAARTPGGADGDRVRIGWDGAAVLTTTVVLVLGVTLGVIATLLRFRRAPAKSRGPLLWAVVNAGLLLVTFALDTIEGVPLAWLGWVAAVPAAATIGVVRYGLYDIDLLVHRSVLYATLTAGLVAVFSVAVALATALVPHIAAPTAAAVTVLASAPLRRSVQTLLDRRLYGLRSHPHELLSTLGRRVGSALTSERILATAVAAVGEGLKAPFARIHLADPEAPEATYGRRRQWTATALTLNHRGRAIGELVVQQRGPDEPWTRRERRLLSEVADQLGPTAASVRLTRDLQAARERLVRAREEELRRLQRDLHDGVGAALAGARMLVHARRSGDATESSDDLLVQLDADLGNAAAEIRRIVDNLRPPALDRGLPAALHTAARRHGSGGLVVELALRDDLGDLPAAVEVAIYRVVDEALANVVKHARARIARVRIERLGDRLALEIRDDGLGVGTPRGEGIGWDSMRERCQELGGSFEIAPAQSDAPRPGTTIVATIPLS